MSGPSMFAKAQETFFFMLHTPLLPPPPRPLTVEMKAMDEYPPSPSSVHSPSAPSPDSIRSHYSAQSSIELEPSQANIVREMIADATQPRV